MTATALRRAARVLFWLVLAGVAGATLSPIADRPVTPFGPDAERFGAFALASLLLTVGYPRHRLASLVGLLAVAGLLEWAQTFVGGRHGRLHDVAVKAAGVLAGAATARAILGALVPPVAARIRTRLP